jgi:hypothetical protein
MYHKTKHSMQWRQQTPTDPAQSRNQMIFNFPSCGKRTSGPLRYMAVSGLRKWMGGSTAGKCYIHTRTLTLVHIHAHTHDYTYAQAHAHTRTITYVHLTTLSSVHYYQLIAGIDHVETR